MQPGIASLALLFGLASTAVAQTAELTLLDQTSRTPIAGAIVRLVASGRAVTQGLTNEQGRLALKPPAPGTYQVRIDRIGFSGVSLNEIKIEADVVLRRTLLLPNNRTNLPSIVVSRRTSCEATSDGGIAAVALWKEVEKALSANVITQESGEFPLRVREFRREVARSGEVLSEQEIRSSIVAGVPFSALPASLLATQGFVTQDRRSQEVVFAAPDAATLLSDEFVTTHCFRVASVGDSLVGLAFEPARNRRLSDVKGTLWMDRVTYALKRLDYSYIRVDPSYQLPDVGGRLEFSALPSGAWIVSYWYVRMPNLEPAFRRGFEYIDQGGRAELAEPRRPIPAFSAAGGG